MLPLPVKWNLVTEKLFSFHREFWKFVSLSIHVTRGSLASRGAHGALTENYNFLSAITSLTKVIYTVLIERLIFIWINLGNSVCF